MYNDSRCKLVFLITFLIMLKFFCLTSSQVFLDHPLYLVMWMGNAHVKGRCFSFIIFLMALLYDIISVVFNEFFEEMFLSNLLIF